MPDDYTFDLPVSDEQLRAIGMVVVEWSYLESVIDTAIYELADIKYNQPVAEALTVHLTHSSRMQALSALFHLACERDTEAGKPPDEIAARRRAFGAMVTRINDLAGKRNRFVHGRWTRGDRGSPLMVVLRARGVLKQRRDWPAGHIHDVAAGIKNAADQMRTFFQVTPEPDDD